MVLSEFFKNIFSTRKQPGGHDNSGDIGITGLPRNIESDFLQHREKKSNEPIWHGNWLGDLNQPPIHYEILIGPEDRGSHDDAEFFHMSHNIFHEIDEMMKHMFSGFGRLGVEESFPNAENYEVISDDMDQEQDDNKSLREKMLKDPSDENSHIFQGFQIPSFSADDDESMAPRSMMDWFWTFPFGNNTERPMLKDYKDHDFDGEIESGKSKLSDILEREHSPTQQKSYTDNFSFGSFSSIITKKRADGVVESQKTVKDSKGNEEITVIRKIGDQTHKKTVIKDSDGNEEVKEDLLNMNPDDLDKFEQAWSKSEVKDESIPPAMWEHSFRKGHTFSGSLYDSIKDLFLPWNRKE